MSARLIVIEGLDGSGKATQTKLLLERLKDVGIRAESLSFPNYNSRSSELVKMYLAGEVGRLDSVNVYAASSFYSMDRYISFATDWHSSYEQQEILICDRYTTSNLCHQMSKLPNDMWDGYIKWLYDYEFHLLGLPKPDVVVYLDMPLKTSQGLLDKRYHGDNKQKDIHESDTNYLQKCRDAALYAAKKLGWHVLSCVDENFAALDIAAINEMVCNSIKII